MPADALSDGVALDATEMTQHARNVVAGFAERAEPVRFLVHDRDAKFCRSFDEVFGSEGIGIARTPVHAPRANAVAERFVGTARRELSCWWPAVPTWSDPFASTWSTTTSTASSVAVPGASRGRPVGAVRERPLDVRRRDKLGGLIHEYSLAA